MNDFKLTREDILGVPCLSSFGYTSFGLNKEGENKLFFFFLN